jgi:hypothetical protein
LAERRSLLEGLQTPEPPIDPVKAREFVYGAKTRAGGPASSASHSANLARTPLSTRIRSDYFAALKRASLERQLKHQETSTLIEILEEAIEPWLKSNGYLP